MELAGRRSRNGRGTSAGVADHTFFGAASREGAITVVVVDDHPEFRQGLRSVIDEAADIAVVGEAPDGVSAVRLAEELQPDVVLMDLHMPVKDGIAATGETASLDPAPSVIVLTASGVSRDVLDAIAAGAAGYLLKGAPAAEIHAAIRAAAAGGAPFSSDAAGALLQHVRACIASDSSPEELPALTGRETNILVLLALGRDTKQIAEELFISTATVKRDMAQLLEKLAVDSRAQAAVLAVRAGLV